MSEPDHHLPRASLQASEREASVQLAALRSPGELRAALLALLLTPGSQRERRAWQDETRGLSTARQVYDVVAALTRASRVPWLERLLQGLAAAPLGDRQSLVEAARRVMSADGQVRPIDRLQWLAMRHRLGEHGPAGATPAGPHEMAELSLHTLREAARLTAFLSRLVPTAEAADGQQWYQAVMAPWLAPPHLPACVAPDADGLVNALTEVQAMPWMLRPVLVRAWLMQALALAPSRVLAPDAADALRLAGVLLDCPMPPELARHYVEPPAG